MKPQYWLACGLFLLGVAVGAVVGLSKASGISTTLVTTIFTFVGGTLLTFSGFRRSSDGQSPLDVGLVGSALTVTMLGIILGLAAGLYLHTSVCIEDRCAQAATPSPDKTGGLVPGAQATPDKPIPKSHIELNAEEKQACDTVQQELSHNGYEGDQGPALAVQRLQLLWTTRCDQKK